VLITTLTYPIADSFDVYRDGVFIGNTTAPNWTDASPLSGSHTYKIVALYGFTEATQGAESIVVQVSVPPAAVYGKFVGAAVYPAVQVSRVGDIQPRIWPAKKNNTVQA
jgi:hypothetical protein